MVRWKELWKTVLKIVEAIQIDLLHVFKNQNKGLKKNHKSLVLKFFLCRG